MMERPKAEAPLRVRRLRPAAKLPVRASGGTVGYDLHADLSEVPMPSFIPNVTRYYADLGPGRSAMIPTGIEVALPPGTYGRILPLFGHGAGGGLVVVNDVLDADHSGELIVTLENSGTRRFQPRQGEPIATLVLHEVATPEVVEVDTLGHEEVDGGSAGAAAPSGPRLDT